jgi:squalene-hopene/tetraprenyl-beta-curcumene cyclase
MESSDLAILSASASKALNLAAEFSYGSMKDNGHWYGEVLTNTTFTAEYIFLCISLGHDFSTDPDTPALRQWLLSQQNLDGSWGLATDYPGDASTTVETYFALKILQVSIDNPAMVRRRLFTRKVGGIASVRIFTRFVLATFGLIPWSAVPQLPPEFFLLPSYFLLNIYNLVHWARATCIPMLVIQHHEPVYALPNRAQTDFLDKL